MTDPEQWTARTVLEQQIRARRMTFEEFVDYTEQFAREHGEPGTLSLRHLKRLAGGAHKGSSRPATKRLLEAIFRQPWEQLLASPRLTRAPALGRTALKVCRPSYATRAESPRRPSDC